MVNQPYSPVQYTVLFLASILFSGCGHDRPAVSLSCSIEVEIETRGRHSRDVVITIASDERNATLTWLPKEEGDKVWHIRGHLDERFYTGIVDGDLGTSVSIDRTTGQIRMDDSKGTIRRYRGTCQPSKQVF